MTNLSQLYPQWQFALREAATKLSTPIWERTEEDNAMLRQRNQNLSEGSSLRFVLQNVFAIPIAVPLVCNYYVVDGFWFSLKLASVPGEDDAQPVYSVTGTGAKAATTFTLYVGKVVADPDYPNWPKRQVVVGRNLHLRYSNFSFVRADLAAALDAVDACYQAELPLYAAWKTVQPHLFAAAANQDFFMQLIRRALRHLPDAERLPDVCAEADAADAAASSDGLSMAQDSSPTLADLETQANAVIAKLDEMLPPNFEPFDPDDTPDDYDDEEEDEEDPLDDYPEDPIGEDDFDDDDDLDDTRDDEDEWDEDDESAYDDIANDPRENGLTDAVVTAS